MSMLIVQLPAQPRLAAQYQDPSSTKTPSEVDFVFSADGRQPTRQGRCAPAALPRAQIVVAVLPPEDVGWHRITLPRAPGNKLRAALVGVMEDALLEDESELHLALQPLPRPGESTWVAAVGKAWLTAQLQALEAGGLTVDKVVPSWWPDDAAAGHVFVGAAYAGEAALQAEGESTGLRLAWRDEHGPVCLPLAGDAVRAILSTVPEGSAVRWTASPECAAEAARFTGAPVAAQTAAEFAMAAALSGWNLRQFDMAPQRRGARAVREGFGQFLRDPAWRAARWGIAALLLVNLVGLNLWAWQQRQALKAQQMALGSLLKDTFPKVSAVIDPSAQMQKEVDVLRAAAGRPGEADFETMMAAAAQAWPAAREPAESLKFEPGRLTIASPGWTPQEVEAFRNQLRAAGIALDTAAGRLTLTRTPGGLPALPSGGRT